MKKKFLIFFILGLFVILSVLTYKHFHKKVAYFVPIPIEGYSRAKLPYIKATIEDQDYLLTLDLGFSGYASINPGELSEIKNKSFVETITSGGWQGEKYKNDVYRIPLLEIGKMNFHPVLLKEESSEFSNDSVIYSNTDRLPEITAGSLGSKLFATICLCIDLHASMIVFCDSFETFKNKFNPVRPFTKVPFQFDNGFIEFDMKTSEGSLHCIFDSGATWSLLNTPNPDNLPIEDFIKNKKRFEKIDIGKQDFGPIVFSTLPFQAPMKVDAILGVDFLQEHIVVIDFINHHFYIRKNLQKKEKIDNPDSH